jgi:hypothetical protein
MSDYADRTEPGAALVGLDPQGFDELLGRAQYELPPGGRRQQRQTKWEHESRLAPAVDQVPTGLVPDERVDGIRQHPQLGRGQWSDREGGDVEGHGRKLPADQG